MRGSAHGFVLNTGKWVQGPDSAHTAIPEYVHTNAAVQDELIKRIEASVQQANSDREWRKSAMGFMTVEHHRRATLNIATKKGLEQGREQARREETALIDALLDAGRIDDLKRAADDASFRQSFLEEFHIS